MLTIQARLHQGSLQHGEPQHGPHQRQGRARGDLYPTPYQTPNPKPYTSTLDPAPCTLALYTLHLTPYAPHL